jgi:hypothetical protein
VKHLSIEVIRRSPKIIRKVPYALAKITIGDFDETFNLRLGWWKIKDYESQWHTGIEHLKNYNRSCLITDISDPSYYPFVNWWLLYKEDDVIYIRNEILYDEYYEETIGKKEFTKQNCYDFIGPKKPRLIEEGRMASEWVIPYE